MQIIKKNIHKNLQYTGVNIHFFSSEELLPYKFFYSDQSHQFDSYNCKNSPCFHNIQARYYELLEFKPDLKKLVGVQEGVMRKAVYIV